MYIWRIRDSGWRQQSLYLIYQIEWSSSVFTTKILSKLCRRRRRDANTRARYFNADSLQTSYDMVIRMLPGMGLSVLLSGVCWARFIQSFVKIWNASPPTLGSTRFVRRLENSHIPMGGGALKLQVLENASTEKASTNAHGQYYRTYSVLYRLVGRLGFSSKG